MDYKNNKLYLLTIDQHIKTFDFSGVSPIEENRNLVFRFNEQPWEYIWKKKIAIDQSGKVLMILSLKEVNYDEEKLLFYVFKMNFKSCKWERVNSIGDNEMLIFGHGVTVRAPVRDCFGDGTKSGLIHFTEDDVWPDNQEHEDRSSDYGVFDIATSRIEWTKKSCFYINKTQWFVPGVAY